MARLGSTVQSNTLEPELIYFGLVWYTVTRTAQYNLGWLNKVQFNVIYMQHIKLKAIQLVVAPLRVT